MAVLQDLLDTAHRLRIDGDLLDALKVYRLVLEAAPLDFDLRLTIGDLLSQMEHPKAALKVYEAVASHDIRAGNPLRAMVAAKLIAAARENISTTVQSLVQKYAAESPVLGRSVKLAPADYSAKVRDDIDLQYPVEHTRFVAETALLAADTESIRNYPQMVPPVPIFSTLDAAAFGELFAHLTLFRFAKDAPIVRQGDPGDALFFIARGEVSVVRKEANGPAVQLARLGAGSLFGEMALLSADPRSASVVADTPVDVLTLTRKDAEALGAKIPAIAGAMARFMRERLINNLLSTNPLFKPFDDAVKKQLLARFKGHEVPAGTVFLEEGDLGRGLYVILMGKAAVTTMKEGEKVHLADIGPGDIVGEMSLLNEAPVSATVCTKTPATLLFLARELFLPLIEAVPALKTYFTELTENRTFDAQAKITAQALVNQAAESEDGEFTIDEDDVVFI